MKMRKGKSFAKAARCFVLLNLLVSVAGWSGLAMAATECCGYSDSSNTYPCYGVRIQVPSAQLLRCGEAVPEFAIATEKGTKVADVVWCSDALWQQIKHQEESAVAPEIYVEVLSSTNTEEEMREKRRLYFTGGAEKVWICDQNGDMQFFCAAEEIAHAKRVPEFPKHIEI